MNALDGIMILLCAAPLIGGLVLFIRAGINHSHRVRTAPPPKVNAAAWGPVYKSGGRVGLN